MAIQLSLSSFLKKLYLEEDGVSQQETFVGSGSGNEGELAATMTTAMAVAAVAG